MSLHCRMCVAEPRPPGESFRSNARLSPAAFARLRLKGIDRHKVACCVAYLVTLHPPVCSQAYGGR